MKTDELFYELFKFDPHSLFRLVGMELEGTYAFESITTKTTEKRFDGFCKRTDASGPLIFLEIQSYYDPTIYWRLFREISTYYEQTGIRTPFIAIVLFLDEHDDPENYQLLPVPPNQLLRVNLINCLNRIWDRAGVLTVLKPLVIVTKEDIIEQIPQWRDDLNALALPEYQFNLLIGLLEYLLLQRFPELGVKEVEAMLHLTPIEQTVAGRELIQIG